MTPGVCPQLSATAAAEDEDGHCLWYGSCGPTTLFGAHSNCPYTGPAKPLTDQTAIATLRDTCPFLFEGKGVYWARRRRSGGREMEVGWGLAGSANKKIESQRRYITDSKCPCMLLITGGVK